jgi:hypothetical protein
MITLDFAWHLTRVGLSYIAFLVIVVITNDDGCTDVALKRTNVVTE